jgi:hypothetical protein
MCQAFNFIAIGLGGLMLANDERLQGKHVRWHSVHRVPGESSDLNVQAGGWAKLRRWETSRPQVLFQGRYESGLDGFPPYDVSADGKRFLFVKPSKDQATANEINVRVGWAVQLQSKFRH